MIGKGPVRNCQVCENATSKYKCPSCLIPYCSLLCYKKHKETPCSNEAPSDEKPSLVLPPKISLQVEEPNLLLDKKNLECIAASDEVREALNDEKLKKLILSIDSATNSESELDKAMQRDDFRKFTEKILSVIGS